MRSGSEDLNIKTPPNTLGFTEMEYRPGVKVKHAALKNEMCDFSYSINNGDDPEDIKVNSFLFDEGLGNKAIATTGLEMALGSVGFAATYCGSSEGDKDGDGVKDALDSCPEIFNPKQEDTKEIALGFPADGIEDACDNCDYPNKDQTDTDGDGRGDDVIINGAVKPCDNYKLNANFYQSDVDNDGIGDSVYQFQLFFYKIRNFTGIFCCLLLVSSVIF